MSVVVVSISPVVVAHLRVVDMFEHFRVQQFEAQASVEALNVPVLPSRARLHVEAGSM